MGEPSHLQTPMARTDQQDPRPDPADLPVPEDDDLNSPKAEPADVPAPEASSSSGPMTVDPLYAPPAHESFQDRRRRFDQQETIWTRKKARTDDGDVDLNLPTYKQPPA